MPRKSTEEHPLGTLQYALFRAMKVPRRAECLAAIREALEAGADINASGVDDYTPLHEAVQFNHDAAALKAAVEVLLAAGANVRAKDYFGREPLHRAALNSSAEASAAAAEALLEAGADALAKDNRGRTPLRCALYMNHPQAGALLAAMPTDAALEELCASDVRGYQKPLGRLLPAFVASRLPLADTQWAIIPVDPRLGLARALPTALASSVDQARQLVRLLPALDAQRLRTAALCLARTPLLPQHLPLAIMERILCFAVDDS